MVIAADPTANPPADADTASTVPGVPQERKWATLEALNRSTATRVGITAVRGGRERRGVTPGWVASGGEMDPRLCG